MKKWRRSEVRKRPNVPFLTPSRSKEKYPNKISNITSHVNQTEWNNDVKKKISSLSHGFFQLHDFPTRQHNRNRRNNDEITRSKTGFTECANSTFTIKYEDDYRVWNNFSIMYQDEMYH